MKVTQPKKLGAPAIDADIEVGDVDVKMRGIEKKKGDQHSGASDEGGNLSEGSEEDEDDGEAKGLDDEVSCPRHHHASSPHALPGGHFHYPTFPSAGLYQEQ